MLLRLDLDLARYAVGLAGLVDSVGWADLAHSDVSVLRFHPDCPLELRYHALLWLGWLLVVGPRRFGSPAPDWRVGDF